MTDMIVPEPEKPATHPVEKPEMDFREMQAALAKARGEFPDIPKNRTATVRMKNGGQYSYKYADLADVFHAIDPVLAAYGLSVSQFPDGDKLITEVMHESGAIRRTPFPIKPMPGRDLSSAQDYQSAVQVTKRYALTAALGISTEETVEGDPKAKKPAFQINEKFETDDGRRVPKGANITDKMTPREMAVEAARAIEAQMDEVKTIVGLNGVWNRNQVFIDRLSEKHDDLFQNIYEKFHAATEGNEE